MTENNKCENNTKQETVLENAAFDTGDPIATFVLQELSTQNARLEEANKRLENANIRLEGANKRQNLVICALITAILGIVIAFLLYLSQFEVEYDVDQTGVYTFMDSEGNIISADISPEDMVKILEVINGENPSEGQNN